MSKLYYTNPIVAAYMAEEFGARFINRENQELSIGEIQRDCHPKMSENDIYYIHPDSLDIFEPKEGDICQHPENNNCYSIEGRENISWAKSVSMKIIQRDNKPFFMPEIEE